MKYLSFFILCVFFISCKEKAIENPVKTIPRRIEFKLPDWAKSASIYEANTRHMSVDGDFNGLTKQLPRLKDMGIDIVWLMPINPISIKKRKAKGDLLVKDIKDPLEREKYHGSPYAVADYKKVNPKYGTMSDFKNLLNKAHDLELRILIDWVPNHTGWDNPWITEHPEWYTKDSLGNIIDPIDYNTGKSWGWTDVADLNYDNNEMRLAMIDAMKFWLTDVGIDGFRVDVAHGIPQDFWDQLTPELLKAKSDVFLLAESEVPSHRNNKTFHMDYGWELHHIINDIANGKQNAYDIDTFLSKDKSIYKEGFHMHFTSNHDENTWAGPTSERLGIADKTLWAFIATFDGMPLIYSGMEEPIKRRLPFFTKDIIEWKNYAYAPFFKTFLDLKKRNQALWNGKFGGTLDKVIQDENVFVFSREKNGDKIVGIFNLSNEKHSVKLPAMESMKDVLSQKQMNIKEGELLSLKPWQYYVLSNK